MTPILTDDELVGVTGYKQSARQAEVLDTWRVPYQRRPDGTLVVGRVAFDTAMAGGTMARKQAGNGLNWSRVA